MRTSTTIPNVVVLGMHRSGTSALAGAIQSFGWTAGDEPNLLPADTHNAKGYFERNDVVAANERLLTEAAKSAFADVWAGFPFFHASDLGGHAWLLGVFALEVQRERPSQTVMRQIEACVTALQTESSRVQSPFVLKDPRLCCTLRYWREFLPDVRTVAIVRSPYAVARSIAKLNALPHEINSAAWAFYTYNALQEAEVVVLHEDLISKPEETLGRVLQGLTPGAELTPNSLFIDPSLNHHVAIDSPRDDVFSKIYRLIARGDLTSAKEHLKVLMDTWIVAGGPTHAAKAVVGGFDENAIAREILTKRLIRLNNHALVGRVLLALRKLKGDPTFGAPL